LWGFILYQPPRAFLSLTHLKFSEIPNSKYPKHSVQSHLRDGWQTKGEQTNYLRVLTPPSMWLQQRLA
jgi:hypothetical protein